MSFASTTVWEVRSSGSSSSGGGFDVGATFPTDLAATNANTASPVVTSASYTFVAGDVNSYVFIPRGTNWIPGFYPIASVSGGAATLNAAVGAVVLYGGSTNLNTAAGCATVASPTAGVWGLDYSQQNSARLSYTDMVIGATTTQFTSAANPVGVNLIGNIINVTGGTGFTVQRVQVTNVSGTTATCDKSLGTAASTGGTGNLGGALDGLVTLGPLMVTSNRAFVTGPFTQSATATFSAAGTTFNATNPPSRIEGYSSYRGDGGRATITISTSTGLKGIALSARGWFVQNIAINCASLGTSTGFALAQYTYISNCKASNFTTAGIDTQGNSNVVAVNCEVTGGTSAATASISNVGNNSVINGCHVHDNACQGVLVSGGGNCALLGNLVVNNAGASSDGVAINNAAGMVIAGNTIAGNGRSGISWFSGSPGGTHLVRGNILAFNGAFGFSVTNAGTPASGMFDGNAYYSNTSGARNNLDDAGATNKQDGVAPYINAFDVILTGDPFVNAAGSPPNWGLNNTAGAGAAARGHGVPQAWPGNSATQAFPDMGAVQHADSASTSTYVVNKVVNHYYFDSPEP